jgi:ketosteroid isomerase-like protein
MNPNEQLIDSFYSSFQKRDAEGMAACYHNDVTFSDPAFGELHGKRAADMWRMLCARGKDLVIEFGDVRANDTTGSAHWEARYTFMTTGRKVHNIIDASFAFADGKIIKHTDAFEFHRWAGQALGPMGKVLGGTRFLQRKVNATAVKGLDEFQKAR